jgi:hypothetical protein
LDFPRPTLAGLPPGSSVKLEHRTADPSSATFMSSPSDAPPLSAPPEGHGSGAAAPATEAAARPLDVVFIQGATEDRKGLRVLRARPEGIELGEVRPLEEGKPILGDVVKLEPTPGFPMICQVKTELRVRAPKAADAQPSRSHSGPAKVASEAYRSNWDAIWSDRRAPGKSN